MRRNVAGKVLGYWWMGFCSLEPCITNARREMSLKFLDGQKAVQNVRFAHDLQAKAVLVLLPMV
jgi:hypothetical protein